MPVLSVALGYDVKIAIAASLIGVIATSLSASPRYIRTGIADRRLGLLLLVAAALGGLAGGLTAGYPRRTHAVAAVRAAAGGRGAAHALADPPSARAHARRSTTTRPARLRLLLRGADDRGGGHLPGSSHRCRARGLLRGRQRQRPAGRGWWRHQRAHHERAHAGAHPRGHHHQHLHARGHGHAPAPWSTSPRASSTRCWRHRWHWASSWVRDSARASRCGSRRTRCAWPSWLVAAVFAVSMFARVPLAMSCAAADARGRTSPRHQRRPQRRACSLAGVFFAVAVVAEIAGSGAGRSAR